MAAALITIFLLHRDGKITLAVLFTNPYSIKGIDLQGAVCAGIVESRLNDDAFFISVAGQDDFVFIRFRFIPAAFPIKPCILVKAAARFVFDIDIQRVIRCGTFQYQRIRNEMHRQQKCGFYLIAAFVYIGYQNAPHTAEHILIFMLGKAIVIGISAPAYLFDPNCALIF